MTDRPDLHTEDHDQWDQGGYCNNLVLDTDGTATVCGYRKPSEPFTPATERVRDRYIENKRTYRGDVSVEEAGAEFDRWLAGQKASALREAAEHFVAANFSHTTTTPTLFSQPTPGRYGDARDEMTGHLLQRHDRVMIQRWLVAEADRIEVAT